MRDPEPIYAWQVLDLDGRWGIVSASVWIQDNPVHFPLITRERSLVGEMRPIAKHHAKSSGRPVRLHRFIPDPDWEAEEL